MINFYHNIYSYNKNKIFKYLLIFISVMKKIIMKVWTNNSTKQKLITIPKNCDIVDGDYVEIKKIK